MRVLVVNAGSSSLKLRLLDGDDAILAEQELHVAAGARIDERALRRALACELGEAEAIGHRIVHGGERFRSAVQDRRRRRGGAARADRPGAAASAQVAGRPGRGHGAAARAARGRLLRHRVSRDPARRGRHLRAAGGIGASAGSCAATAFTASPTPGSRAARRSCSAAAGWSCGSSAAIWAPAPRYARSTAATRATRRWGSRRWRAS